MFKKSRITFFLVTFAMLSTLISACDSSGSSTYTIAGQNCQKGSISFDGSTALYPLAKAIANKYQDACSGATITPKQNGSAAGLKAANDGIVQIGNSDIFVDAQTYPALVDHQVAAVVFSMVLNPEVTGVTNLTSQQLIEIYAGTTTNWKDIGGPDLGIIRVSRSAGSGTRATFDQYVLNGGTEVPDPANPIASQSSELATLVNNTRGAIGYVTTFYARQNHLNTIKIDDTSDTDANVKSNSYKFWNIEHMYTKGAATGLTKAFIDYISGDSADVQSTRTSNGFLALSYLDASAIGAKQPKA